MSIKRSVTYLICVFMLAVGTTNAQNWDAINVPFVVDGDVRENALIGGLIAPQFLAFDLDGQAPEDLIVFDRSGGLILPFISSSTPGNPSYAYAPEYRSKFPRMNNFVQFHDFNGDGKKDIFTSSLTVAASVMVYRNTSDGDLSFEKMSFDLPLGDVLHFQSGGDFTNLYVSNIDVPAITDVDGDGDLDFLTFEPGGSYMYYYKNMVVEQGLPADTLVYKVVDLCWGKFFESGNSEELSLSTDPNNCSAGLKGEDGPTGSRHSGSTVLAIDADGDADVDLILGDLTNNKLVLLENDPVNDNAFIVDQDVNFPSYDESVNIFTFISTYYIDIDADGRRDMIAAVNAPLGNQNTNHIWYYQNIGTDESPVFSLRQKDFLHNTSLQMGSGSHPAFVDYNADGLLDLLVGSHAKISGASSYQTSLYLYENTGTPTSPAYTLVDADYLSLRSALDDTDGYLTPSIGDLDGDGDDDLLVGDKKGYLFYFENAGGAGSPYDFQPFQYQYQDIKVGVNVKPAIVDLDGDGLNDLVVGEKNDNTNPMSGHRGGLNYFRNEGSVGNPIFYKNVDTLANTNTLGAVLTRGNSTSGESAPCFFEVGGEQYLSVGSKTGDIYIYNDIEGNLYDSFNIVYPQLPIQNAGIKTSTAYGDIDGDGFFEVIVGNENGGLMAFNTIFEADPSATLDSSPLEMTLHPNPSSNYVEIIISDAKAGRYIVYDMSGRVLLSSSVNDGRAVVPVDGLAAGMYFMHAVVQGKSAIKKFVKI